MLNKFNKLYNEIIMESKKINSSLYTLDKGRFGFICPICHQFSNKTDINKKNFICKYTPHCHGKTLYIDFNNPKTPEEIEIINNIKNIQQQKLDNIKKEEQRKRQQKQQKQQKFINDITTIGNKIVIKTAKGRFSSYNSALDEYHVYYNILVCKRKTEDKIFYDVLERTYKIKTYDSIPSYYDFQFTGKIKGQAYSLISDPTIVFYDNDEWEVIGLYDPNNEYKDYYQPSTYGT